MKPTHNRRVQFSVSLLPWLRDFLAVGDAIFDIVLTATLWAPKSKPQESEWTKCGRHDRSSSTFRPRSPTFL